MQNENTLDLREYLRLLKGKIVPILLAGVLMAAAAWLYSTYRIQPVYQAYIQLIVNADKEGETKVTITDAAKAASLVDTYAVIIKSNRILNEVIRKLELEMDWRELDANVQVSSVNETSIMLVTVSNPDPELALRIVQAISEIAPKMIVDTVHAGSCEIVSDAYNSIGPVYPDIRWNTQLAFIEGVIIAIVIIIILHIAKSTILLADELRNLLGLPVLGVIPDVKTLTVKAVGRDKSSIRKGQIYKKLENDQVLLSPESPFAYAEAFKMLRTNFNFVSLNGRLKKIMITSTLPDEHKTCVSINVAISLAETGAKVIIVDCDLRKGSVMQYLNLTPEAGTEGQKDMAGLSEVLSGQARLDDCILYIPKYKIYTITAGSFPPNPSELLNSVQLGMVLDALARKFDYVICDTPPVGMVSDPLNVNRFCDGVMMLVRQDFAKRDDILKAKNSLAAVKANLVGSILVRYNDQSGLSARKGYYRRGGYYYYSSYKNKSAGQSAGTALSTESKDQNHS